MCFFRGSLLISAIAVGLSASAFAQPKADAGSGPTKGAVSTDDAGSGPRRARSQIPTRPPQNRRMLPKTVLASRPVQSQPEARSR
jgi:hypothetical protein